MKTTTVKTIAEAFIAAALTALLIVISIYAGPLSLVASILCGIPIMILTCKYNIFIGFASMLMSFLVTVLLTSQVMVGIILFLIYIIPALVFGHNAKRGVKYHYSLLASAGFVIAGLLTLLFLINNNGSGNGIEKMIMSVSENAKNNVMSTLGESFSIPNVDIKSVLAEATKITSTIMLTYIPSGVIIATAVITYLITSIGIFALRVFKVKKVKYTKFSMIRAPRGTALVLLISLLLSNASNNGVMNYAAQNIIVIIFAIFTLTGLSFVDFILTPKVKSGYARAGIYVLVCVVGFMLLGLIIDALMLLGAFSIITEKRFIGNSGDDDIEKK